MKLCYFFQRIFQDKLKLTILLILLILPSLEVIQIAWSIHEGYEMPNPHYATFLSLYTLRHHLHKIVFWFLPLFLLLSVSEDSLEDYESGYKSVLMARSGKRQYILNKLKGSFTFSFGILFLALMMNMILVYVCFKDGTFEKMDWQGINYEDKDLTRITIPHPVITNVTYIVLTSILAGLIGTVGTALALSIHNRKIVYGITFMLWFAPVNYEQSLMYVIQPFLYADYDVVVPTLITLVVGYLAIILIATIMEVRGDEV